MIETYLLRSLAEIERASSFTAAAKALFVSQPALSRAMQKLEGELGVALFDRSGGRTSLSPLGRDAAHRRELRPARLPHRGRRLARPRAGGPRRDSPSRPAGDGDLPLRLPRGSRRSPCARLRRPAIPLTRKP